MNLQNDKTSSTLTHPNLLYVSFNQDHSCFACGTENGFSIWNCNPFKQRFRRDFEGGIGIVEMLYRCNIIALVGGGKRPHFPRNKIIIWDDYQCKSLAELEFSSPVLAVRMVSDRVVAILEKKIYVYSFEFLKLLQQIETLNPRGLIALASNVQNSNGNNNNSNNAHQNVMHKIAYPHPAKIGTVCIQSDLIKPNNNINKKQRKNDNSSNNHMKITTQEIRAHNGEIAQMAFNADGSQLATASDNGTLIRIWDTASTQMLYELRRGSDRAIINSISFSSDSRKLSVSSNKMTIHVFTLIPPPSTALPSVNAQPTTTAPPPAASSSSSSLWSYYDYLPSFSSLPSMPSIPKHLWSWSDAQCRINNPLSLCAFGNISSSSSSSLSSSSSSNRNNHNHNNMNNSNQMNEEDEEGDEYNNTRNSRRKNSKSNVNINNSNNNVNNTGGSSYNNNNNNSGEIAADDNTVIVVSADGMYYRFKVDVKDGGEGQLLESHPFVSEFSD